MTDELKNDKEIKFSVSEQKQDAASWDGAWGGSWASNGYTDGELKVSAEITRGTIGEPEDEYEAIVRELAERGPYGAEWGCMTDCNLQGRHLESFDDPANHEPQCLWRRARELHPPTT